MKAFGDTMKKRMPYILAVLPYVLTEVSLRIILIDARYFRWEMLAPSILFSCLWAALFLGVSFALPRLFGRIVYGILTGVTVTFFTANALAFRYTGYCFSFNLMQMADEGGGYVLGVIKHMGIGMVLVLLLILASFVAAIVRFPTKRLPVKKCMVLVVSLLVLHIFLPLLYGPVKDASHWDAWRNPANIYRMYNDKNKSLKVSGLTEYTVRDFYVTFLRGKEKISDKEEAFLREAFADRNPAKTNAYTGLLKGKNVIFLQLEGIDSWLVTEDGMPNLYHLMQESVNFTNHYSFFNGGGSTFNSEFAVNTGFVTPTSYSRNAYTFNDNYFPYSMPRLFRAEGYRVEAFHMNSAAFYSRGVNYDCWGYESYNSLLSTGRYAEKDIEHQLDRTLITDETFHAKLFATDAPTVSYLITYTPHTPFDVHENPVAGYLSEELYGQKKTLSEEEAVRLMAAETDRMVGMLVDELKATGLYDKTVLVVFTDHYLYTLMDKDILRRYKEFADTDLVNVTPFFIWSSNLPAETVTVANSQTDILPTVLNLMGISYVPSRYIGRDIFAEDFPGIVFFPRGSIYDGETYLENGKVSAGKTVSEQYIKELSGRVSDLIRKNDLALKYDWFRMADEAGQR